MLLRPYQHGVITALNDSPARRRILVAPTGSGKTIIAAEVIRATPGRSLFLVHRRELVFQARNKLAEFGIEAGIILAGEAPAAAARVQVASIQTLWRRSGGAAGQLPPANLVVIDEAHHCRAKTYQAIM